MDEKSTKLIQQRKEEIVKFLGGEVDEEKLKELGLISPIYELFNPLHFQVSQELIDRLVDSGGKGRVGLWDGEFWVDGGKKLLIITPNQLPPRGYLDGEEWFGVVELKEKLGLKTVDERKTEAFDEYRKLITPPPMPKDEEDN